LSLCLGIIYSQINPLFTSFLIIIGFLANLTLPIKNKYKIFIPLGFLVIYFFVNSLYITYKIPYGFRYKENFPTFAEWVRAEPEDEKYRFDGFVYSKVFFLMEKGLPFYKALPEALKRDARFDSLPTALFNYRLPTIFYIWKLFLPNNGLSIVYLFIILSCGVLVGAYFICAKFIKSYLALLSPIFLFNYLLHGSTSFWFSFAEYWGMFFAVFGLTFFVQQKRFKKYGKYIPLVFTFLASIIREHFVYLTFAGFISSLFLHKKNKKFAILWVLSALGFLLFMFFHYLNLQPYLTQKFNIQGWLFKGGLHFLSWTMNFGLFYYPYIKFLPIVFIISALLGCLFINNKPAKFFLFLVVFLPILGFCYLLGPPGKGEYWGVIYMPFCITLSPLIFQIIPAFKRI
jgi:hypothetical protein